MEILICIILPGVTGIQLPLLQLGRYGADLFEVHPTTSRKWKGVDGGGGGNLKQK